MFKVIKGLDNVDHTKFFKLSENRLRGHSLKLFKSGCHLDCRKFAFSFRSVDLWNSCYVVVITLVF